MVSFSTNSLKRLAEAAERGEVRRAEPGSWEDRVARNDTIFRAVLFLVIGAAIGLCVSIVMRAAIAVEVPAGIVGSVAAGYALRRGRAVKPGLSWPEFATAAAGSVMVVVLAAVMVH